MSSERAPTPMHVLRQQADLSRFKTEEYSLKIWLNMAKQAFDTSASKWSLGKPPKGDEKLIEEAYVHCRMGAEFFRLAMSHPGYKNMSPQDRTYLIQVKQQLYRATSMQPDMATWLERREKEWNERYGALGDRTNRAASTSTSSSTPAAPALAKNTSHRPDDSIDGMIDGYGNRPSHSSHPSQADSASSAAPAPSPPLMSITERLANLRASGMTTGTKAGATSSSPTRAPPLALRHAAIPKPPHQPNIDGFDSSTPVLHKGDSVSDAAEQRSGSAPPVLPQSEAQDGLYLNGVVAGDSPASSPKSSRDIPLQTPSSPTGFESRFPGLDDFEASSKYALPSVPSFEPGRFPDMPPEGPGERAPLAAPPQPFDLDAARREQPQASSSKTSASSPPRSGLPSALIPGRRQPPPLPSTPSSAVAARAHPTSSSLASFSTQPPLPPPTAASSAQAVTKQFNIPFTTEVTPIALNHYLNTTYAESGRGPRVLLLDLRSREEYERSRIRGETVCLEPIVLRNGITSSELESALTLSPIHEQKLFAARHHYDIVIVYDRASSSLPTIAPHSTSSESQRLLWNLVVAIYEREFQKSLKRQPVLLKGGWEAWERQIGGKGIEGTDVPKPASSGGNESDGKAMDAFKKANRKASIAGTDGTGAIVRNGGGTTSASSSMANGYRATTGSSSFSNPTDGSNGMAPSSIISPRLAMPPQAAQPSSSRPSFESGYTPSGYPASSSSTTAYSPHPPQPHLNGMASSQTLAYPNQLPLDGSPTMTRSRGDYGDLHTQSIQSFSGPRPSIDYPQLQPRGPLPTPPSTNHGLRPTNPPALPPVPLTRPPAVRAAPQRSNSSFTGISVESYSSSHSNFPSNFSFEDNAVGLTGLKNLGNTCYMNSTIQCLSATIPFARYFKDRSYRRDVNVTNPLGTRGALADAVSELIRAIWAQQYMFLSPVTFRENICRFAPQFKGSDQHDAQEFLGFLLDGLHEDLNYVTKKPAPIEMSHEREHDLETLPPQIMSEREWEIYRMRNDSFVVQCFQGQFRNQLKCLTCGKTSTTYNTFMPLSIPIPSGKGVTKTTLYECIQGFVREEILDKDDAWFCPKCKTNRKATKKLSLSRLPPILVIHLKRFSFHGPFSNKIETQVQFPLSGLDLTSFIPPPLVDPRSGNKNAPSKKYIYDLFGVTNHYGNLSSGHYTAYVRSGREWHNIGDSKVTFVDPRIVESAKSAYILYLALRP